MKTIGLIGGSTWVSTIDYYKYLNLLVNERLGGVHSAKILLYSFNFNFLKTHSEKNDWETVTNRIIKESQRLIQSGADCIVLCANTLHYVADKIQAEISVPIIHIADAVGKEVESKGLKRVGLLGTNFTMEKDFYKEKLNAFGIECLIPELEDRKEIHRIIYNELSVNQIVPASKEHMLNCVSDLQNKGADAIILACTELPLIILPEDTNLKLIDTTYVHAKAVVDCIFGG